MGVVGSNAPMLLSPRKIAAYDPGGTTGACFYENGTTGYYQYTGLHHQKLYDDLVKFNPDYVVVESFKFRQIDKAELIPVEYIGVIHLYSQVFNKPVYEQTPSQAKGFWTDDKLKKLGMYVKGQPHANDATRHLLWNLTFTRKNDSYVKQLQTA